MVDPLALRSGLFDRHGPTVHVADGRVSIALRAWFGEPLTVPVGGIAVADLVAHGPLDDWETPEEFLHVPSFVAGGGRPTLLLLFADRLRVPPLRSRAPGRKDLPFGLRTTRSHDGARIDGLSLRAVDAAAAVRTLAVAGAEVPDDPQAWLFERR